MLNEDYRRVSCEKRYLTGVGMDETGYIVAS